MTTKTTQRKKPAAVKAPEPKVEENQPETEVVTTTEDFPRGEDAPKTEVTTLPDGSPLPGEVRTFEIEVPGDLDITVIKSAIEEVTQAPEEQVALEPREQVIALLKQAGELIGSNPIVGGVFARHEIERALVHLS